MLLKIKYRRNPIIGDDSRLTICYKTTVADSYSTKQIRHSASYPVNKNNYIKYLDKIYDDQVVQGRAGVVINLDGSDRNKKKIMVIHRMTK